MTDDRTEEVAGDPASAAVLVHDALASHTDDFGVGNCLHELRPHATFAVDFEGRRAVCKVATHPAARPRVEAAVLDRLAGTVVPDVPVPEVLERGTDPSHVVLAWDEAVPDPDEVTVDPPRVRAMGRGLARLHEATAGWGDRPGLLSVDAAGDLVATSDPTWPDTLRRHLVDCRRALAGVGYADVADRALAFLDDHGDRLAPEAADPVLVHGNYLPAHVGVDRTDERVTTVIDFEHCLVGSPEWDYLRAAGPLFRGRRGERHGVPESTFREAYESVRPLPPGFDDRRDALVGLNAVTYLRALHLQRGDRDSTHAVGRRARALARFAHNRLAAARERWE